MSYTCSVDLVIWVWKTSRKSAGLSRGLSVRPFVYSECCAELNWFDRMSLDQRSLEFNIVSANDLKKVKIFGKQSCFIVVYVNPSQKVSTKVDRVGGRNPCWNSRLLVTCDEQMFTKSGSYITVEIYCAGRITNKLVGTVTIPLNEVGRDGKSGATKPQVMAYQVRRRSGKVQGVLNLAVKLGERKTISTLPAPRVYGKQQPGSGAGLPTFPQYSQYSYGSQHQYDPYRNSQSYSYGGHHQAMWPSTPQY